MPYTEHVLLCDMDPHANLLSQMASALRRVQDLIVEDREVEGQTQPDGVSGRQVHEGDILRARSTAVRSTGFSIG